MPPGIFIIILLIAAYFAKRFKIIFLSAALIFWIFSLEVVGNFFVTQLEKPYNHAFITEDNIDAVVMLGGGSRHGSANFPIVEGAFKRFTYGMMLGKKENLPVVHSGKGLKNHNESDVAIDCANEFEQFLDFKIPLTQRIGKKFSLILENESLDTYQNAAFSKGLFEKNKIENPKVYLVTSAAHMKRAEILFKHFGFTVFPAATDFRSSNELTINAYLPSVGGFTLSYIALHEFFGIVSLYLRGII